jgi:protein-disulfide isomerase
MRSQPEHRLIEYGDYECPHCRSAQPAVERLRRQAQVEFRNFPITTLHPHAQHAAEAAEAARSQGKFWEYHDLLFENQEHLEDEDLIRYAQQLGLDLERFRRDLQEHTFAKKVRDDFMAGVRAGVNGTPTFFIDDKRYDGAVSYEALRSAMAQTRIHDWQASSQERERAF